MYFNVEKSGFHHGQYVGYAHGAWRIMKTRVYGANYWMVKHNHFPAHFMTKTLKEASNRLDSIAKNPAFFCR